MAIIPSTVCLAKRPYCEQGSEMLLLHFTSLQKEAQQESHCVLHIGICVQHINA